MLGSSFICELQFMFTCSAAREGRRLRVSLYDSAVVCAVVSIGGGDDGTASIVDLDSYLLISATCMSSTNK